MKLNDIGPKQMHKKMNKIYESRFGFTIDYDNLTIAKAQRLTKSLSENIATIRKSFGMHTAEKNPRYMELLLVKEGLDRWIESERATFITEGEVGTAQAVLAAKDIVDTVQDAIEKLSKIQNEELPALYDSIYDQIGSQQADQYRSAVGQSMTTLIGALNAERDKLDKAARVLAGEQTDQPMDMGGSGMGDDLGGLGGGEEDLGDFDADEEGGEDLGFGASDVAAGGASEFGRERR